MPRLISTMIAFTIILTAISPAIARTIGVPGDAATISGAMAMANRGDIILVSCGTYHERNIQMKSGVSLWSGTLQADCAVIDAQGRGRILDFTDCDSTTAVVGFTLKGGLSPSDGGAIACRNSSPRIARCLIIGNKALRGGGLATSGALGPRLEECRFEGNTADLHGGAVVWLAGNGSLSRCTMADNQALAGAGLAGLGTGDLALDRCTFSGNTAASCGGGIWMKSGTASLTSCLLVANHGGLGGGGLAIASGGSRLTTCTLADNAAESAGGGILLQSSDLVLERSILAFNRQGAVAIEGEQRPSLTRCNVYGHQGGDWIGPLADLASQHGNFSDDPKFCSRVQGRYDLRTGSPCLPGARGGRSSGLVGALNRGCD